MMKTPSLNPAVMPVNAQLIAPKFTELIRTGSYSEQVGISRRDPSLEARNIALESRSGLFENKFKLHFAPHPAGALVVFDLFALRSVQQRAELRRSISGYVAYDEIGRAAGLTEELFKMPVEDAMALAACHTLGLAKAVETFLNMPS